MRFKYTDDPIQRVKQLDQQAKYMHVERELAIQKALKSQNPSSIIQAQKYYSDLINSKNALKGGKAMLIDPFEKNSSLGYYDKQSTISFHTLAMMAKAPIIRAIINTRKDQIADFSHPQPDKHSRGFIIRKKKSGLEDPSDAGDLDESEKKEVESLIEFLLNGGDEENKWHADSFESFVRKIAEDSLTLDQYTYEVVRYRNKDIAEFYMIDSSTIRISDTYNENGVDRDDIDEDAVIDGYLPSYVQLYQNRIVTEFYPWELGFGVRNPQNKLSIPGYGKSELEDMIQIVTSMLNADSYNANFFQKGSNPKGMLMVKKAAGINPDQLNEFKSEWQQTMSGVENFHKTPVLDAEHVEWLDLHKNNKEMEFSKYQEYLIKLGCAIYKISPEEVGFTLEGSNRSGIGGGGGRDAEKKYSKEKGLAPILRNIQRNINKYLIGPKSKYKYEFCFVGLDSESEKEEEERLIKAVGGPYMEINEARQRRGLDEKPEYDTLSPLLGQGNASSDAFMDQGFGGGEDSGGDLNTDYYGDQNGEDVEKGNPMWDDAEKWWDENMAS